MKKKRAVGGGGGALAPGNVATGMQSDGTTQTTAQRHKLGCLSAALICRCYMSINFHHRQCTTCAVRLAGGGASCGTLSANHLDSTPPPENT